MISEQVLIPSAIGDETTTIQYEQPNMIGHGSFGKVFRTTLYPSNEVIAIKSVLQDPKFKNRELQIMKLIHHPNIVDLKYFFYKQTEKQELYLNLVLEYVPETLYQASKTYTLMKTRMPFLEIKLYFYQILRAVNFINMHGICHRDLKPQNLLVNPLTNELKLCDFGSAKVLTPSEPNVSYACSRYYRAPELIFGNSYYSTKIDVWAIGCIIGELILGRPLFIGESSIDQLVEIIKILGTPTRDDINSMNPNYLEHKFPKIKPITLLKLFKHCPRDLVELLAKLLNYDPNKRIDCMNALLNSYFDELKMESLKLPDFKSPIQNATRDPPPLFNFNDVELSFFPSRNNVLVPEWAQSLLLINCPLNEFQPLDPLKYKVNPI